MKLLTLLFLQFFAVTTWASCEHFKNRGLIEAYTGHASYYINSTLRHQKSFSGCSQMAKDLEMALKELPPVETIVFRGSGHLKEFKTLKNGDCVQDRGFLSTSYEQYEAEKFAKGQMLLMIRTYSGRDVTSFSIFQNESEILLLPGTWLKLLRVSTLQNGLREFEFEEVEENKCTQMKITL